MHQADASRNWRIGFGLDLPSFRSSSGAHSQFLITDGSLIPSLTMRLEKREGRVGYDY